MTFGIICAMPEELHALNERLTDRTETVLGGKTYLAGTIENQAVVLVESGIGKVEAGITAEHLITDFKVDVVINSGSAGGIGEGLHVGDVVIATETAYHDVDVTAFGYEYGQLPAQPARFSADPTWVERISEAGKEPGLNIKQGLIVTGDQSQKDLPAGATSGLDTAIHVLKKIDDIGFCYLTSGDVVRHPLVQKIVEAYDAYEKKDADASRGFRRNSSGTRDRKDGGRKNR